MDENQTDHRQGCHLDVTGVTPGVVIVAATERIIGELRRVTTDIPRIPSQLRRVPGANCPVTNCPGRHDDPPQVALPS